MWLFYLFFFFLFEVFLLNLFHPQVSLILWACMIDWFSSLFSTILLLFFHYNVLPLMLFNLSEIHVHFLLYNLLFLLYLARLSWDNLLLATYCSISKSTFFAIFFSFLLPFFLQFAFFFIISAWIPIITFSFYIITPLVA